MSIPEKPITREEMYLYRLATGTGEIPEYPVSRYEAYLDMLVKNGGGYSKAEIDRLLAEKGDKTDVEANTEAIDVLNGTGEGSVSKTVNDKVAEIVAGAPEDFDTLKELSDWLYDHEDSAAAMNTAIQANTAAIAQKANSADLAAVATSGAWNDVENKPFDSVDTNSCLKITDDGKLTEDIQIGGRNYISDVIGWTKNKTPIIEKLNGNILKITPDNHPNSGVDQIWFNSGSRATVIQPENGLIYTFSLYMKADADRPARISISNTHGHVMKHLQLTTEWQKFSVTGLFEYYSWNGIDTPAGYVYIYSDDDDNLTPFYIKNAKFEIGNKATDWTPAPEDFESRTNNIKLISDLNSVTIGTPRKNLFNISRTISLSNTKFFPINNTIPPGKYILSCKPTSNGTVTNQCRIVFWNENKQPEINLGSVLCDRDVYKDYPVTLPDECTHISLYSEVDYDDSQGRSATFYDIMLRPAYISDNTYEPYKPSIDERLRILEEWMNGGTS